MSNIIMIHCSNSERKKVYHQTSSMILLQVDNPCSATNANKNKNVMDKEDEEERGGVEQ